jgi:GNAT superfamily N-acetyltransferase
VVGTIVRADRRGQGIGTAQMSGLARQAARLGVDQLWVATGGRAIDFYRRCGFSVTEVVQVASGDQPTVLTARLAGCAGSVDDRAGLGW